MRVKFVLIIFVFLTVAAVFPSFAAAAETDKYMISVSLPGTEIEAKKGFAADPGAYVKGLYDFAMGAVGLLALGMIVYGAIEYIINAGNVSRQSEAKDRITQAIYGLVLLLGAVLILRTIRPEITSLELYGPKQKFPEGKKFTWAPAKLTISEGTLEDLKQEVASSTEKFEAAKQALTSDPTNEEKALKLAEAEKEMLLAQYAQYEAEKTKAESSIKVWEAQKKSLKTGSETLDVLAKINSEDEFVVTRQFIPLGGSLTIYQCAKTDSYLCWKEDYKTSYGRAKQYTVASQQLEKAKKARDTAETKLDTIKKSLEQLGVKIEEK